MTSSDDFDDDDLWAHLGPERSATLKALTQRLGRSANLITLRERSVTAPSASAIGGPAWRPDDSVAWPKDGRGVDMMHLARLNFAEMPPLENFPPSGLLQFFISTEDIVLGADKPHGQGFLLEWWPSPGAGIAVPQPPLDEDGGEGTPLIGGTMEDTIHDNGRGISFSPGIVPAGADDPEVSAALQEMLGIDPDGDDMHYAAQDLSAGAPDAWVGGLPYSAQSSAAEADDVVLLQIGNGENDAFMWGGDVGAATFLIAPADLIARRFEAAIYDASGF
ncbi:MAG: DUF1963 domain-containing protein [Pseudomonadota bacterium]